MEPGSTPASVPRACRIDFSNSPHARELEPPVTPNCDFAKQREVDAKREGRMILWPIHSKPGNASSQSGTEAASTLQAPLAPSTKPARAASVPSSSGPLDVLAQLRRKSAVNHKRSNSAPNISSRTKSSSNDLDEYEPLRRHETVGLTRRTRRRRSSASSDTSSQEKTCRGFCLSSRCDLS